MAEQRKCESLRAICSDPWMPGKATVFRWLASTLSVPLALTISVPPARINVGSANPVCTENSDSDVLVVQSAD
jgi:hypothetical protein